MVENEGNRDCKVENVETLCTDGIRQDLHRVGHDKRRERDATRHSEHPTLQKMGDIYIHSLISHVEQENERDGPM